MSQNLARREQLTERVMLKLSLDMKQRLYAKAAKAGRTVSDFTREALVHAIGG
jgi:predicted DNA-binding protein